MIEIVIVGDVQAKRNLEACVDELSKYQSLSRTGLSRDEMIVIDGIMIRLKERMKRCDRLYCDISDYKRHFVTYIY